MLTFKQLFTFLKCAIQLLDWYDDNEKHHGYRMINEWYNTFLIYKYHIGGYWKVIQIYHTTFTKLVPITYPCVQ